jgi:hypothetical protein
MHKLWEKWKDGKPGSFRWISGRTIVQMEGWTGMEGIWKGTPKILEGIASLRPLAVGNAV